MNNSGMEASRGKKKVLILGKLPPPYIGPAVATEILLQSQLNERYQLLHVDTNIHDSIDSLGVLSLKKVLSNMSVYAQLVRVLRVQRPDLVLIPISQTSLGFSKDSVFILLSRLFGCNTLIQLRGSNFQNWLAGATPPVRAYVEKVLRKAQGVIVLGERLRYLFEGYFPASRIFVVPNGADYLIPPPPQEQGGAVHVLYLANLLPQKGIEDLIRATVMLQEQGVRGFSVDVVGAWRGDETRETCLRLVEEHGLPVTFHGPAYDEDKFAFLAKADVFVFPPWLPEGHPWVIVEAMAAGLPIIATDQGAIAESVHDGVNGFIVTPRNPEEIAARLLELIEDPALRARQSEASKRLYENGFTEQRMVDRLSEVFDVVMGAA